MATKWLVMLALGAMLTAASVRADEKAFKKQLDELNQLSGDDPTAGALNGILDDKKQMKELLEFGLPAAKKKTLSFNAAYVLAQAAADAKDMKTAEIYFRVCMDQAAMLQSAKKMRQSYVYLAAFYFDYKQYANCARICKELLELNTNDGKDRIVIATREEGGEVDFGEPQDGFVAALMLRDEIFEVYVKATAKQGKHEQAIKLVDNLLKKQKDFFNQHLQGWVFREAGKLEDAANVYEDIIKQVGRETRLNAKQRDVFIEQFRREVSNVYVDMKKIDRAAEHLEILLKKNPDKPVYYNDLGYIWADHDMKLEEAEKLIRKAIDLDREIRKKKDNFNPKTDHDSGAYLDSLGWVLFKLKKNEEAKQWLLKAVEDKAAQHIEIYDHLGDVHLALGEKEAAIRAYEKGLEHINDERRDMERKAAVEKKLEKLKSSK